MSELAIFNFQSKKVRVVEYQGQPWFVLRDLLEAMDSKTKVTDAVESINQGLGDGWFEKIPLLTAGGEQQIIVIAEAALLHLVQKANKWTSEKKQVFAENLYQFLNKEPLMIIQTRQEIEFRDLLTKILEPFGCEIISQYQVDTYKVDFYIKDLNLVIEYDEEYHNSQINDDAKRQKHISQKLGCDFIRLSNKESHPYNCGLVMKHIFNMKGIAE